MKTTGMIRQLDALGRVVLPIELRRTLDISEKDALEIYVEGDKIILHKDRDACVFCGSTKALSDFKGRYVCADCLSKLKA